MIHVLHVDFFYMALHIAVLDYRYFSSRWYFKMLCCFISPPKKTGLDISCKWSHLEGKTKKISSLCFAGFAKEV